MRRYLIIILFIASLFFASCGSDDDSDSYASVCSSDYVFGFASRDIFQNDGNSNPLWKTQWDLHANHGIFGNPSIHASASLIRNNGGHTVTIAILDDGFNLNHEDLKGLNVIRKWNTAYSYDNSTTSDPSQDISEDPNNKEDHGTATLGIIAARDNNVGIMGLATTSNYQFILVKMCFDDACLKNQIYTTSEIFRKVQSWNPQVISCSWGTVQRGGLSPYDRATIASVAKGENKNGKLTYPNGVNVVFSSGNGENKNGQNYGVDISNEANIPEVISVGASNSFNRIAHYSNYGENLDLVAPGGGYYHPDMLGIPTLYGHFNNSYYYYNSKNSFIGTSASAPLVSGAIALILAKNPNLTRPKIINILHSTSDKISFYRENLGTKRNPIMRLETCNYDSAGFSKHCAYGKLNLEKALAKVPNPS